MSVWRRKALELLPNDRREIEDPESSLYTIFGILLSVTVEAHKNKDKVQLIKYYGFAEWCYRQKEKELWNAAGVAFYEHLGDRKETKQAISQWIKHDIFKEIKGLLEMRLDEKEIKMIEKSYQDK